MKLCDVVSSTTICKNIDYKIITTLMKFLFNFAKFACFKTFAIYIQFI